MAVPITFLTSATRREHRFERPIRSWTLSSRRKRCMTLTAFSIIRSSSITERTKSKAGQKSPVQVAPKRGIPFLIRSWRLVVHAVHEGAELARTRRMTQLTQRFRLDLADALASDCERLTDLLEGVFGAIFQTEAHLDHLLLASGQRTENIRRLLLEVDIDDRLRR